MTDFHVFADESGIHASAPFLLIGGIWVADESYPTLTTALVDACNKHGHYHEIKWQSVEQRVLPCYIECVDIFMDSAGVAFNSIAIEKTRSYLLRPGNDPELGFYKFYFQLLWHRMKPGLTYHVRVDRRRKINSKLPALVATVNNQIRGKHGKHHPDAITNIQAINSERSPVTQLADVLLGAISASYEGAVAKQAKKDLIDHIQTRLSVASLACGSPIRLVGKYNNWQIQLN